MASVPRRDGWRDRRLKHAADPTANERELRKISATADWVLRTFESSPRPLLTKSGEKRQSRFSGMEDVEEVDAGDDSVATDAQRSSGMILAQRTRIHRES